MSGFPLSTLLFSTGIIFMKNKFLLSLPETFGGLVLNNLFIVNTRLESLPESFGGIHVKNDLVLSSNFDTYPESFGGVYVGRDMYIDTGRFSRYIPIFPESFCNVHVGRDLYLINVDTLPDSFGKIRVKRDIFLDSSYLKSLPDSFGQLRVRNLYIDNNTPSFFTSSSVPYLETLPENFGDLKIDDTLYISNGALKTLPESFGNISARCIATDPLKLQIETTKASMIVNRANVVRDYLAMDHSIARVKLLYSSPFEHGGFIKHNLFDWTDAVVGGMYNAVFDLSDNMIARELYRQNRIDYIEIRQINTLTRFHFRNATLIYLKKK